MATASTTPAKTTRPSRTRAAAAPAKATPPAKATTAAQKADATAERAEVEATPTEAATTRTVVELEHVADTKSFSKWQAPADSGCAGNFYAPLGAVAVKIAVTVSA